MNEIERAIKHFEGLQKRYTTQHNGKHCDLVATALEALREQAERNKGCFWCSGDVLLDNVKINGVAVNISCCPMCGKRLEVERDG
jgi:hypothetical protein